MECKDCLFLFDDYTDELLKEEAISEISEHLADCEPCAFAYKQFHLEQELFERYLHNADKSPVLWKSLQESITPLKAKPWWLSLFEGSISIPKPVLGAALILIATAFISANVMWKRSVVTTSEIALKPSVQTVDNASQQSEVIEKTKFVEVPVIKERVVTKIVYIERQKTRSLRSESTVLALTRSNRFIEKSVKDNITVSGIPADKGYFTQVDLSQFQPTNETKVRVISEVKGNEK
jgi:hypothetical protein